MFQKPDFKRYIAGVDDAAAATVASSVIAAGSSAAAQASMNKKTREFNRQEAEKQRAWSEAMYNKQNAWNYEMWQKTNEYNSPEAQVQRMRDAGLNPLFYGLDGSSAGNVSAAQPLGYSRAGADNQVNPIAAGIDQFIAAKGLENSTKLVNAQIDKLQEERNSLKLDNEFKEKTMSARVEGENLANNLTKEQIEKVKSEIKVNEENVKKLIEETKNEIEKRGLILAQTTLTQAQEREIVELIPYKKNLMEAQTAAQKAAASASYMHALYEKGLIDGGYIDKLIEDLDASIAEKGSRKQAQDAMNALNEWKLSVKNGNAYDLDSIPNWRYPEKIGLYLVNELFKFTSSASEAVGGGLSGFIK